MEKIIITKGYWNSEGKWKDTTAEVNELLDDGWIVKNVTSMGAYGYGFSHQNDDSPYLDREMTKPIVDSGFAALLVLIKP